MATTSILRGVRRLMQDTHHAVPQRLAAYLIPSSDAHNSEYLCPRDERRRFVSGFTGSAGFAIVTQSHALLWTDGRYYVQAEHQLDANWTLMREGSGDTPTRGAWLASNMKNGDVVGADPWLVTQREWMELKTHLDEVGVQLVEVENNLVDMVWNEQPDKPDKAVNVHHIEFAGISWAEKVNKCREAMRERRCGCLVLSSLDDVAWLLNLRGSDIQFNPVFFAYVAITMEEVHVFIAPSQVTEAIREHLSSSSHPVNFSPYEDVASFVQAQQAQLTDQSKVWLSSSASRGLASLVDESRRLIALTPVTLMKAMKNETEINGLTNCHVRDGAALCAYLAYLESAVPTGTIDEVTGANKLDALRSQMDNFVGLSFDTISGSGPNGAIIHYKATEETSRKLVPDELYLVDSGGQYKDGTTDVTRTVHFGVPTQHQKECFTRVLKGHIALATCVFPNKLVGNRLDSLARLSLWKQGLDYLHGTGHGVGAFLNVHEGPMGISWRPYPDDPGLQEGMVLSNEPGYYEDGAFGIRIENLIHIVRAETTYNFKDRGFLAFKNFTLVPIQTKLILPELLTQPEIDYLNQYHEECREKVGTVLRDLGWNDALKWLVKETQPIG